MRPRSAGHASPCASTPAAEHWSTAIQCRGDEEIRGSTCRTGTRPCGWPPWFAIVRRVQVIRSAARGASLAEAGCQSSLATLEPLYLQAIVLRTVSLDQMVLPSGVLPSDFHFS